MPVLLRLPGLRREIVPEALDAYLALQYVPGPRTALRGIEKLAPAQGGEIWLVDAINRLAQQEPVFACQYRNGRYYDCGNKLGYLQATVEYGLRHPQLGAGFRTYLDGFLAQPKG